MKGFKNKVKPYIVQKYGGFFLSTTEKIKSVADKIAKKQEQGYKVIAVISAMGETTNNLIALAKLCADNPDKKYLDMLTSTGEQVAVSLLAIALKAKGIKVCALNAFQAGIKTKGKHTQSVIENINADLIKKLAKNNIVLITGFQGVNAKNEITTLGRGGSDTTAVAFAAYLKCPCEFFKDVGGIYTIDPHIYSKAKKYKSISYKDMIALSACGAKVTEQNSIKTAQKFKVPLNILSYENGIGTKICNVTKTKNKVTGLGILPPEKLEISYPQKTTGLWIIGSKKQVLKAFTVLTDNGIPVCSVKVSKNKVIYIIYESYKLAAVNLLAKYYKL